MATSRVEQEIDLQNSITTDLIKRAQNTVRELSAHIQQCKNNPYSNHEQIKIVQCEAQFVQDSLKRMEQKAQNCFFPVNDVQLQTYYSSRVVQNPTTLTTTTHTPLYFNYQRYQQPCCSSSIKKNQSSLPGHNSNLPGKSSDCMFIKPPNKDIPVIQLDDDEDDIQIVEEVFAGPHPLLNSLILHQVFRSLSKRDLISARLVCHTWNEESTRTLSLCKSVRWVSYKHYELYYEFESIFSTFRQLFLNSFTRQELFFRHISVNSTVLALPPFQELLSFFGQTVKSLNVTNYTLSLPQYNTISNTLKIAGVYAITDYPTIGLYHVLTSWCPNLEKLSIDCLRQGMFYEDKLNEIVLNAHSIPIDYYFHTALNLKEIRIGSPVADIRGWKRPTMTQQYKPPIITFLERLIAASPKLAKFKLPNSTLFAECIENFPLLPFVSKNLKALILPTHNNGSGSPNFMELFNSSSESENPLEFKNVRKISFEYSYSSRFLVPQFENVLQKFSKTLTVLNLDFIPDFDCEKLGYLLYCIKLVPNLITLRVLQYNNSPMPYKCAKNSDDSRNRLVGDYIRNCHIPHDKLRSITLSNPDNVKYENKKTTTSKHNFCITGEWILRRITENFRFLSFLHLEINRVKASKTTDLANALKIDDVVFICLNGLHKLKDFVISVSVYKGNAVTAFNYFDRPYLSLKYFTIIQKFPWITKDYQHLTKAITICTRRVTEIRLNNIENKDWRKELLKNAKNRGLALRIFETEADLLHDIKITKHRSLEAV